MQDWRDKYRHLQQWWQTPMGEGLLHCERAFLKQYLYDLFGYQLLIVASEEYAELTHLSRMQHTFQQDPFQPFLQSIPAVDAIIVPHLLSLVKDTDTWLQQCWLHLKPGGKLIITGYHYISELGLQRLLLSPLIRELPRYQHRLSELKRAIKRQQYTLTLDQKFAPRLSSVNPTLSFQPFILGNLFCLVASKEFADIKLNEFHWKKQGIMQSNPRTGMAAPCQLHE